MAKKHLRITERKEIASWMLKTVVETYPEITAIELSGLASTFYNMCLKKKKDNIIDKTPLTLGKKK